MYEDNRSNVAGQAIGQLGLIANPMESMTCGQNLERKIQEQVIRLRQLKDAKAEMMKTGLYDVKISTLRDTMIW